MAVEAKKRDKRRSKLSDEQIISIFEGPGGKKSIKDFAEENDVSIQHYYNIKNWETYLKIEEDRKRFAKLQKIADQNVKDRKEKEAVAKGEQIDQKWA
mgnify:CR=1 FL=1